MLEPVIQLVACFQKAFDPIAAGIWSEPSNRKTAFGSCRIEAASWSMGLVSLPVSRPLLAVTQPPSGLLATLLLAHRSVDR